MNLLQSLNIKRVLLHLCFWVFVWFYYRHFFSYNSKNPIYAIWFSGFLLPITIVTGYYVIYSLIPQYLIKKRYYKFALFSFCTIVYSMCCVVITVFIILIRLSNLNVNDLPPLSKNIQLVLVLIYIVVGFMGFVKVLKHNYKTISKNKELQNKVLESQLQLKEQELEYLKKQIHPHFLFNTLNTIYGFALKQSKHTPDIILKLSNLLDYILYQVKKPKVSLKEEVMHIKEYIELEKIRFKESLNVSFSTSEITESLQIAPMLLIPFVENTFKHGNIVDGFLSVDIRVFIKNTKLEFSIKNSIKNINNLEIKGGIGLENIRKRLNLQYGDNYLLENTIENNWYIVNLIIFDLNQIKDV